jgi:uncharacterized protein YndB with AHSA1/START domain
MNMADYEPLNIKKTYEAPRQKVWEAWTTPEQLAQWFMPEPFSIPKCELDVRVGGKLRVDTQGPDGVIMPMVGEYSVVDEPEKLVMTNSVLDAGGQPMFTVQHTVVFSEADGKTTLDITAEVLSAGAEAAPFLAGMEAGLNQALDQLGELVTA